MPLRPREVHNTSQLVAALDLMKNSDAQAIIREEEFRRAQQQATSRSSDAGGIAR
jgi:hypothetical protein